MPCSCVRADAWASWKRFQRIACCAASSPRSSTSLASQNASSHSLLLGEQVLGSVVDGPLQRARAAVGELLRRARPVEEWYDDELDDAGSSRPARPATVNTVLARSAPTGRARPRAARRVDHVAVAAGERHPAVGAAVAEHDLALSLLAIVRCSIGTSTRWSNLRDCARVQPLAERRRR